MSHRLYHCIWYARFSGKIISHTIPTPAVMYLKAQNVGIVVVIVCVCWCHRQRRWCSYCVAISIFFFDPFVHRLCQHLTSSSSPSHRCMRRCVSGEDTRESPLFSEEVLCIQIYRYYYGIRIVDWCRLSEKERVYVSVGTSPDDGFPGMNSSTLMKITDRKRCVRERAESNEE